MQALLRRMLPGFARTGIAKTLRLGNGMLLHMASTLTALGFDVEDSQKIEFARVNGLNVSQINDFYSPLPSVETLKQNLQRWYKPSDLIGVQYDLETFRTLLLQLVSKYHTEYKDLPSYGENKRKGFGPGFTKLDAMVTYFMVRDIKPRRYIEIGSGLSTFYSSLAATANAGSSRPVTMTCIDPYPCDGLKTISGIEIIQKEVQDVPFSFFDQLTAGDILFIDSTHIVKLDGDVPYLYLEILPRLKAGCFVHIHDIHFPYNVPYPSELYVLGRKWPVFWTEAMLLQAFLCLNDSFQIVLSTPLLRHFAENFLSQNIPGYESVKVKEYDTHFGSIWLRRVKVSLSG